MRRCVLFHRAYPTLHAVLGLALPVPVPVAGGPRLTHAPSCGVVLSCVVS
jgi:hypothetical protein